MVFDVENLFMNWEQKLLLQSAIPSQSIVELRAEQLYKAAEFLDEYFKGKYDENLLQARCLWVRVQLDKIFFDALMKASETKNEEERRSLMEEIHTYVEDFLIAYCEKFAGRTEFLLYAGHHLHFKMPREKAMIYFKLMGMIE